MSSLLVTIAFGVIVAFVVVFEVLRFLAVFFYLKNLKHQHIAPKGQFKIVMPAERWDAQMASGVVAVAITDSHNQVYMSLLIEKGPPQGGPK